jgi:hypothetical protein
LLAAVGLDNTVRLWDVASRNEVAALTGHQRRIHFVTFSHSGTQLATAGMDRRVMLWDTSKSSVPVQPRPEATGKDAAADTAETKGKGQDAGKGEGADKGEAGQGEGQGGSAIRSICQADVAKLCAGEEHVGRCLRQHESELSDSCVAALKKRR